jgi:hypothetical protein
MRRYFWNTTVCYFGCLQAAPCARKTVILFVLRVQKFFTLFCVVLLHDGVVEGHYNETSGDILPTTPMYFAALIRRRETG